MEEKGKEVTEQIEWSGVEDELLALSKCVCGAEFEHWEHIIGIYPDDPTQCPKCGRWLYFSNEVRVYEVPAPEPSEVEKAMEVLYRMQDSWIKFFRQR